MEVFKLCAGLILLLLQRSGGVVGEELGTVSNEGELVEKLLSKYHKHGRPVLDAKKPINVTLGATLQQIIKVDPNEETFTAMVWLNFAWKDQFLSWNASQAEDIEQLRLDIEDIWIPDIEVYNLVSRKGLRDREQVVLESSGDILWVPPYILTTTCKMDLTWFPFDEQSCSIKFGSWTHHGFLLDIQIASENMDISSYVRNEEWALTRAVGERNEVLYECCPEPYLDITYTVHLRRKNASHVQRYLVPSGLLTFLGILSLFLPASQPSSRLLILIFTFLMISLGSSGIPHPSLMATLLGSCSFTLLLLIVHTILVASLANSRSFYLACSPICPRTLVVSKENQEEAFRVRASKIAWWVDFAAFWIYLLCFGVYFTLNLARFPVVE